MNWIFTTNGSEEEINKQFSDKCWPIFHFTRNRKKVNAGDLVVVYHAGYKRQNFVGSFSLNSALVKKDDLDYFLRIRNCYLWEKSIPIKQMVPELSFIKNKLYWGTSLQNGVITLPKKDYDKILSKRNSF